MAIRPSVVDKVKQLIDALGDEQKIQQLDVLVNQHRSAQMLMDKTLGASSVVNQDNIGELLQEMLHPYLEEERKRSAEFIKGEKIKARKKLKQVTNDLEQAQMAGEAAASQLKERWLERLPHLN